MADQTLIEWTDATWNPITGCTMVDAGCTNCYAMGLAATRMRTHPSRAGLTRKTGDRHVWTGEVRLNDDWIDQPLRWTKPRRIFVCAHGDLFHEAVPEDWIDRVFAVMALCPQHTFQVLTKRPDQARDYLTRLYAGEGEFNLLENDPLRKAAEIAVRNLPRWHFDCIQEGPFPNVWLGTSISDQASADARIPALLQAPAAIRFLSAEPLLGPVDLRDALPLAEHPTTAGDYSGEVIDWVIVGGESGHDARPMHPDWVRDLRDQCTASGTAFFFKQWGEWAPLGTTEERRGKIAGTTPRAQWHDACGLIIDTPKAEDPLTFFSEGQVFRLGKKTAGRQLDGREWNDMPVTHR